MSLLLLIASAITIPLLCHICCLSSQIDWNMKMKSIMRLTSCLHLVMFMNKHKISIEDVLADAYDKVLDEPSLHLIQIDALKLTTRKYKILFIGRIGICTSHLF